MKDVLTRDRCNAITSPFGRITVAGELPCLYYTGAVFTPEGIVAVYQEKGAKPYTRMDFIYQGFQHTRTIEAYYSHRYTITLARRFAREVLTR